MNKQPTLPKNTTVLGKRIRQMRKAKDFSQRQLADLAGISFSTISKIENNQFSPTYDSLTGIAKGLQCDIIDLFHEPAPRPSLGRRSVTRKGEGFIHRTNNYHYELLCNDMTHKKLTPLRVTIKSKELQEFGGLSQHEGEELIFVLSGSVEVHTQFYKPEILEAGDCIYFDSTMKHACLNRGESEAVVFWVCSSPEVEQEIRNIQD